MTNASERANGPALPSDRRAFLGKTLAAAMGAALPAAPALTSTDHPDAALFALIAKARELYAEEEAAEREAEAAYEQIAAIERPAIAAAQLQHICPPRQFSTFHYYSGDDLKELRFSLKEAQIFARHAQGVIEAVERYEAERAQATVASGFPAAQACRDRLHDAREDIWRQIINTPAVTGEGVIAKLALSGEFFDPDEIAAQPTDSEAIALSAALDARRLAGNWEAARV